MSMYYRHHHRRSIRLKGYDYSRPGAYFVTICTQNRKFSFGDVVDGEMVLNDAGKMVEICWREIPTHYPNVILDSHVIMPNHVHAIIIITNDVHGITVGANYYSPLRERPHGTSNTVGAMIRGYKIGVTKWFRNNSNIHHVWQRNYYENIVRNDASLNRVRQYIVDNPRKWESDRNNPDRIMIVKQYRDSNIMEGEIKD